MSRRGRLPMFARIYARIAGAAEAKGAAEHRAEMLADRWLSVVLLGGLLVNAAVGWWWADPIAALAIAGLAAKEGIEAW